MSRSRKDTYFNEDVAMTNSVAKNFVNSHKLLEVAALGSNAMPHVSFFFYERYYQTQLMILDSLPIRIMFSV